MKFEPQKYEKEKMTQKKSNPITQILQDDNTQQEFIRKRMQAGLQSAIQMEFDNSPLYKFTDKANETEMFKVGRIFAPD
jgi:hypothetical protein